MGRAAIKLVSYRGDDGVVRTGVAVDGGVVDVAEADSSLPNDMLGIIQREEGELQALRAGVAGRKVRSAQSVQLLAPVPHPPEFIGVGLNYHDHAAEAGLEIPATLTVFNKQTSSVIGPFDDVVLPAVSAQFDYEGELGLVIGRAGRHLTKEEARAAIFGYVVVNDLSVRDWQFANPTVTLGKSFDTHGPFGPWIVTADEIENPQSLAVTTRINGELRQSGNTRDMIFDCAAIVAFLSRVMTLRPGTIVTTGTPAGVGLFRNPPGFLRAGDTVTVEIAGVGRLVNRVVAERSSSR